MRIIALHLPDELAKKIDELAAKNLSRSEVIRLCIAHALQSDMDWLSEIPILMQLLSRNNFIRQVFHCGIHHLLGKKALTDRCPVPLELDKLREIEKKIHDLEPNYHEVCVPLKALEESL